MTAAQVRSAKIELSLRAEQRADAAAATALRTLLEVVRDNLDGAIDGADSEYLHQLRIAVRRSRTVQRQFRGVFPATELLGFRAELRWLQRATGEARDLDVYVEEFDALAALVDEPRRGDLEPLRVALQRRRLGARERLRVTLRSPRLTELCGDWERLLESLVELPVHDRPAAQRPLGELTGERVTAVYRRIVKRGARIDADSPAERYHDLRKLGKELRYLLELFAVPVYDADAVVGLVRALKGLQEVLGRHQDREVQTLMLRALAPEVARLPSGPAACLAMGSLLERLLEDERAARAEFGERFAGLAGAERRRAVTATFA